jgi:rubrerythrin
VPSVQNRLGQLKKDEKDHRKTLRAHREALFADAEVSIPEEEAERVFGTVDLDTIQDKASLIQALYGAIRVEEYGSYFYEKSQFKMPSRETRIFMEVLASEGRTHARILKGQIDALRTLDVMVDDRGRAVEVF